MRKRFAGLVKGRSIGSQRAWWGGAIVLVAVITIAISIFLEETIPSCNFRAANREALAIHPQRVVVRPWRGQHHVYAVYTIPGDNLAQVSFIQIPGHKRFCTYGYVTTHSIDGVMMPPRSYILKTYLNTRIALWYLVQGRWDDLRNPSNWVTFYSKKSESEGV